MADSGGYPGRAVFSGGGGDDSGYAGRAVFSTPQDARSKKTEKKKKRGHLGPIPLLHAGELPGLAVSPFVWAGEKAGVVPHSLARVSYVLESGIPQMVKHPARTAGGLGGAAVGLAELPYAVGKAFLGEAVKDPTIISQAFTNPGGLLISQSRKHKKGAKEVGKGLAAAVVADYKRRYGKDWQRYAEEDPFNNAADALTIFGGGFRAAAMAGAAERLGAKTAAGKAALALRNPRAVFKESGNFPSRHIVYDAGGDEPLEAILPASRSPLRAYVQQAADRLSHEYPEAPLFGSRARAARGSASVIARATARILGAVPGVDAVHRLNKGEASRVYWGSQLGDYSVESLQRLRDALSGHYDLPLDEDPSFSEVLHKAKQAGFGDRTLEDIDRGIAEAMKNPEIVTGSKVDSAIKALEHATRVSEETILDSHGFSGIEQEIAHHEQAIAQTGDPNGVIGKKLDDLKAQRKKLLADHTAIMRSRRNRVRDWVDDNVRVDAPERTAWIDKLNDHLGEAQTNAVVHATDRMAVRFRPNDPASWWRDRVSMPTDESAAAFVRRLQQLPEGSARMQYSLGKFGAEESHMYYSPLMQALENMKPQMQVGQARKYLREAKVTNEEMMASGVEDFLGNLTHNATVTRDELLKAATSDANLLNLIEHHWTNTGADEWPPYMFAREGAINSREAMPGEYHQMTFGYPEGVGPYKERLVVGGYAGEAGESAAGFEHSMGTNVGDEALRNAMTEGRTGTIAHMRYHIFRDPMDGKMKMLIEEVQSDWASDFAKERRKLGTEYKFMRQDERKKLEDDLLDHLAEQNYLKNEIETYDQNGMYQERERANSDLFIVENEIERLHQQLNRLPPSPLGRKRYLNTIAHRAVQEAHKNGVDEIVVVDGPTQTVRNMRAEQTRNVPWGAPTPEIARVVREMYPEGFFAKHYEEDFPEALRQALGKKGVHSTEAYTGQFRNIYNQRELLRSEEGPMGGTVFKLDDSTRSHAKNMRALYQAADRGKMPKGATEFFQDGTSAIRMFKKGDVSTWMHELSHAALYDLPAEDLARLEKQYGAKLANWTNDIHEQYATDFERYWLTGKAPSPTLEKTFKQISNWMTAVWETAKREIPEEDIHPDVREAFDNMFQADTPQVFMPHRPGSVSFLRGSRGIPRAQREIGDEVLSQATTFRRNRLALLRSGMLNPDPRLALEHLNRVTLQARANQLRDAVVRLSTPLEAGEPYAPGSEYIVKRAGRSIDKPLLDALENADDVDEIRAEIARFFDESVEDNPAIIDKWIKEVEKDPSGMTLSRVDKKTVDSLYKNVTGQLPGAATKPTTTGHKIWDALIDSTRGMLLYANPGFYTANMLGNSMLMMLSDPRAARYMHWSMKQALKSVGRGEKADPLWHRISIEMGRGPSAGQITSRSSVLGGSRKVSGGLLEREALEERRARIAGTLSKEKGRIAGRTAENITNLWGAAGRGSGRVIDDSWRVAAWRQVAHKRGFDTTQKIEKLLDDAVRDSHKNMSVSHSHAMQELDAIRDEAEQLMLDFDSMTPFEKQWLSRTIFLYPFLKASTKYPFMYAGERPIVAGLGGQAGNISQAYANEVLGERDPNLPRWMQGYARSPFGYLPVSSLSPFQPSAGLAETFAGMGGKPEFGVQQPTDYLSPFVNLILHMGQGRDRFGRAKTRPQILQKELPMPAYLAQALHLREPGQIYADRSWLATLERAFRGPVRINEQVARENAG